MVSLAGVTVGFFCIPLIFFASSATITPIRRSGEMVDAHALGACT